MMGRGVAQYIVVTFARPILHGSSGHVGLGRGVIAHRRRGVCGLYLGSFAQYSDSVVVGQELRVGVFIDSSSDFVLLGDHVLRLVE